MVGSVKPERITDMLNGPETLPRETWYELLEAARILRRLVRSLNIDANNDKERPMTPVIAFGEALIDMLSSRLGDNTGPETFTPYAGGAPANVAVACARLNVPSQFLGMVGDDTFGHFLIRELKSHGVDTRASCLPKKRARRWRLSPATAVASAPSISTAHRPPTCSTAWKTFPRRVRAARHRSPV
ncbi:hypothetical protein HAALTHF_42670n [Vreelandella aquamarina]|nr:hypothetical protein HAALTHF_42670n [Halomonas axialensis]